MAVDLKRRVLLQTGLSAAFLALVPDFVFAGSLTDEEKAPIGAGPIFPNVPYNPSVTGTVSPENLSAVRTFAGWALQGWQLTGMDDYPAVLTNVVAIKTTVAPSYLAEYNSAAELIRAARQRSESDAAAFIHLMFVERGGAAGLDTRLGRCREFVVDEIVRHMIANGGFRNFGLVNYDGFISASFYDPVAYRRGFQ